jgi:alpha-aminoadipic semialdehyde synthase
MIIGIRHETKSRWERRSALTPSDLKELRENFIVESVIQSSSSRAFTDHEFISAGITVSNDLPNAKVILGIKEIPESLIEQGKIYLLFSHTCKGQIYNMPMLRAFAEKGCTLIDYEKITDSTGKRLLFFGKYAGYAGMIETLHALGQKLLSQSIDSPFSKILQPYQYKSLDEARQAVKKAGQEISSHGLPAKLCPFIFGFTGYGNVSSGAQEIFNLMPYKIIPASMLPRLHNSLTLDRNHLYQVVFKEQDMYTPIAGEFRLEDYFTNPHKYVSVFNTYVPFLTCLLNCVYWADKYPRIITKDFLREKYKNGKLIVIGDLSCDIDGAIETTYKATSPADPSYTYFPDTDKYTNGVMAGGITMLAVDNLPCEFPRESSESFSSVLKHFIPLIAAADFSQSFDELKLPAEIKSAIIIHNGALTNKFQYLEVHIFSAHSY